MNRGLVLLLALLLLPGCSYLLPLANQPPEAYIDDISPAHVGEGETVTFQGHGTDADGEVVAYRWRSTLDGQLSTLATFETDELSVGSHVIYFKVQDNKGAWSPEVRASIEVEAAGPMAPVKIDSFTVADSTITAGESTTLSWSVSNAAVVSMNQGIGEVESAGTMTISPSQTTTYILKAEGGGAVATAQLTVNVEPAELEIVYFEADPDEVESGDAVTLQWETAGATEVRIDPYVGPVDPSGSFVVYPTGDATHTFTLTATDGVDEVTAEVQVETYVEGPTTHELILEPLLDESGYVRSTGQPWEGYIYVGDDTNDISIQAFLSFDISDIPEDADIVSVVVDFSDHASTLGEPFDGHAARCNIALVQS